MPLPALIQDPASARQARVSHSDGVRVHPLPWPEDLVELRIPFGAELADSGGSSDMLVDGSSTPEEFFIAGQPGRVRYITAIGLEISATAIALNKFGNLAALANGIEFFYQRFGGDVVGLRGNVKTNLDLIQTARLTGDVGGWGDGTSAFLAEVQGAGNPNGYIPTFFLDRIMPPYGIQLHGDTRSKLGIRISDDLTGMGAGAVFNAKVIGFDIERSS